MSFASRVVSESGEKVGSCEGAHEVVAAGEVGMVKGRAREAMEVILGLCVTKERAARGATRQSSGIPS